MKNSRTAGRTWRTPVAAGAALLLAAGVGAYAFFGDAATGIIPGTKVTPPSAEGSSLTTEVDDGTHHVVVLVDGWSKKILDSTDVTYYTQNADGSRTKEDERIPARFTPVTTADIGALAAEAPGILERTAGRMITLDPDLSCDTEACVTGDGELPYSYFTDAASIPGYGESYAGYGIRSALYKMELRVPAEVSTLVVEAKGYSQPLEFHLDGPAGPAVGGDPAQDELTDRNWHLVSSGFGRLFQPELGWKGLDANVDRGIFDLLPLDFEQPEEAALQAVGMEPLLARGLATPVPQTVSLGSEHMTYYTSPTTGCGVGVTCIPGTAEVTFSDVEVSEVVTACNIEGSEPVTMVLHTSRWKLEYPAPTHQYGVWDGLTPEQFEGADENSKAIYSGTPPLVSGEQSLRVTLVQILNGADAHLWNNVGAVAQDGKDPQEMFDLTYDASSITKIQEGRFKTC